MLYEAIRDAYNAGVILVAAAGNEDTSINTYPAAFDEVIAVGAVKRPDGAEIVFPDELLRVHYSNLGDNLDIMAPGGFTTFNDTELRLSWAIFPQLTYSGIARYQVRDTADWIRRNTLALSPLPGGSMALTFYASHNEDTRADTRQRAVGGRATWRPRPTLLLEGGIEYSRFTTGPTHSSPSNLNLRGYWTF